MLHNIETVTTSRRGAHRPSHVRRQVLGVDVLRHLAFGDEFQLADRLWPQPRLNDLPRSCNTETLI